MKIPARKSLTESYQQFVDNPDLSVFETGRFGIHHQLVCRETFLPAYATSAVMEAAIKKYFPSVHVEKKWRCIHCGRFHVTGYFPIGTKMRHPRKEKTLKEAMKNG